MSISRRQLLKSLGISPFFGLQMLGLNLIETADGTPSCINILLHGFFFVEFHGNTLFAVAPKISNHNYYFKDHGKRPHHKTGVVDLSYLKSTSPKSEFPKSILQFSSKAVVGKSGYFITDKALNECTLVLILPRPNLIRPLRLGQFTDFCPDPSGAVAQSIKNSRSNVTDVPLVTALQYDPDASVPFTTRCFYAEHPDPIVSVDDVNAAFDEATYTFDKFDLALQKTSPNPVNCNDPLPDGVDRDDESSLPELLLGKRCDQFAGPSATIKAGDQLMAAVHVATCPQFGVNP